MVDDSPTPDALIPLLDLQAQDRQIRKEVVAAILEVLDSQQFILGEQVSQLEAQIAHLCGVSFGVGVSSGTDALLICLMAEGIGRGDEVIVPDYSFFATAGVVSRVGATPVFVDVEPATLNISVELMERAITPRTRAIIPVHLFGHPADMESILAVADRHRLTVIEDAAQAIGASLHGRPVGSWGHYGCLSFFPSKNLGGAGDGGMVVTNDPQRAEKLRSLRVHGARKKYLHDEIGGNFRLDTIQAAVLLAKLGHLPDWTGRRRANAEAYSSALGPFAVSARELPCARGSCNPKVCPIHSSRSIVLPETTLGAQHVFNQYVVRIGQRNTLLERLQSQGVGFAIYYPLPFHRQLCFLEHGNSSSFPVAECASNTSVAVPIHPHLSESQIRRVVAALEGD